MTKREATALLEARFERVAGKPVVFVAGDESYRFAANQLAVQPDWSSAITAASRASDGFGPIRGFRRLRTRVFGAEVLPQLAVSNGALEFALEKVAADVNAKPVDAALARRGLRIRMVEEQTGTRLDHDRAAETMVRALGKIERSQAATALPVLVTAPKVTSEMLLPAARRARRAVSAPVVLEGTKRRWRIPRWRVAQLLALPRGGATRLTIGGGGAAAYFRQLSDRVGRPPTDADFAISGGGIQVIPSREGRRGQRPGDRSCAPARRDAADESRRAALGRDERSPTARRRTRWPWGSTRGCPHTRRPTRGPRIASRTSSWACRRSTARSSRREGRSR